ncbi:hypothetical protein AOQ84DRAFT_98338 [Glonium stellatum]|uniref:Uncharacterized protein n=1 Tax=Glonium stellatum TaxID=574774 RepID=A0A8E2EV05_9PEZI|nr:hypothetical protein AOQ84DRAFT_98338 [Glonium stellatum]
MRDPDRRRKTQPKAPNRPVATRSWRCEISVPRILLLLSTAAHTHHTHCTHHTQPRSQWRPNRPSAHLLHPALNGEPAPQFQKALRISFAKTGHFISLTLQRALPAPPKPKPPCVPYSSLLLHTLPPACSLPLSLLVG